jgi:hypothetical protein
MKANNLRIPATAEEFYHEKIEADSAILSDPVSD